MATVAPLHEETRNHEKGYFTKNYTAPPGSYERQPGESSIHYYARRLIAIKPIEVTETQAKDSLLRRVVGVKDLIMVGIGAIVGAG